MSFTITLLLFVLFGTVRSHRIGAYSWYSTIGELKTLTSEDHDLLQLLHRRIFIGNYQINLFLRMITGLRRSGERMLQAHYKDNETWRPSGDVLERYGVLWRKITRNFNFTLNKELAQLVNKTLGAFPQLQDMLSVLNALMELQKSYSLKTEELANGYILGKRVGNPLSISSCEYITDTACTNGFFELCLEWANVTKNRIKAGEDAMVTTKKIEDTIEMERNKKDYATLCSSTISGKSSASNSNNKNLKCAMWTNYRHPWLILQPVPMETISRSPDVAVFYSVISDKDIDHLKSIAIKKLRNAQTFELEQSFEVDSYRVAHNCWLSKANNSVLSKLDLLVSAITGLSVQRTSEKLQVANYGIGGHYGPHKDTLVFTPEKEITRRNRKATFMFYLSDVELGGATVFLGPGIAVNPVKGSAVFWHNLLPSGAADNRTVHGSCPVILGDKWVANKWIWETKTEICKPKEYIGRIHS